MTEDNKNTANVKYAIGVDFGGTYVKLALIRFGETGYKIDGYSSFLTQKYDKNALIEQLIIRILKLKAAIVFKGFQVKGVGIGVPGRVDFNRGMVFDLTNVAGWKNVYLKDELESKVRLPVFVDNDANLMALAESKFGAAKGYKDCLCVTLGTGIGGGIILQGKLYRGMNFAAGEIGHISINENGPRCACGSYGCIERFAGNRFIIERTIKELRHGAKSSVKKLIKNDYSKLTLEMLSQAAKEGDKFALSIWQDAGRHVGILLASVVNLLNPEIIVIGGGVANAGSLLLDPIKKTVRERAFKVSSRNLKIVAAKFKDKAGVIGAATLALTGKGKK